MVADGAMRKHAMEEGRREVGRQARREGGKMGEGGGDNGRRDEGRNEVQAKALDE